MFKFSDTRSSARRGVLGGVVPLTVLALLVVAVTVSPANDSPGGVARPTATKAQAPSMAVNGHVVDRVLLDDQLVSYARYKSIIEPRANESGQNLSLVLDPSAVDRGYFVAFSQKIDADRYMSRHAMVTSLGHLGSRLSMKERLAHASASSGTTIDGRPIQLAACGSSSNFAIMYDGIGCTGQTLSMVARDIINDFSVYGFDNKASALWLGVCIVQMKLFTNDNLTGTSSTFGGGGQSYSAIGNGNSASSASTPGSNC